MNNISCTEEIFDSPRKIIAEALVELGEKDSSVVFVSCDSSLGASGDPFRKRFPKRHFEFGIQEASSMGAAAGMSISGKVPFITAYVPFITFRCFEQIRDDVCKTNLNVNIMGNNCGLSVSPLGPTHVILEDAAVLKALPNITIISPADGIEYKQAIFAAAKIQGPVYLRVHRQKAKRLNSDSYKFEIGKGSILKEGNDVTVIANSTMVAKSLEAAEILQGKKINVEVVSMHTLKPIDEDIILKSSSKTKKVITVEEHNIVGGLGSSVADVLIKENPVKMEMIGIKDVFAVVGKYDELLDYYGLTGPKIAESIEGFLKKN